MIRFEGPFGLCREHGRFLFEAEISDSAGIYLWTVRHEHEGFLVHYVGETGASFSQRMKDHMIQTLGGNYRVCDPDLMRQGVEKVLWNGLWRKGTRDKMPEFMELYTELAPVIKKFLEIAEIFFAPLTVDKRTRQRIEGAIANAIKEQPALAGNLLPHDIRYFKRKKDEAPIVVNIECSENIIGLPRCLEA
jgi:hypothetical protein